MQCASSTAIKVIFSPGKYSLNKLVSNLSGETYRNLQLLSETTLKVLITSLRLMPE